MFSINALCYVPVLISTASALAIAGSQSLVDVTPGPLPLANSSTAAQVTGQKDLTLDWPSTNSSNGGLDITCDAGIFGRGLTVASCVDALATIKIPSGGPVTIGPRTDSKHYYYNLPLRWISADGLCTFDIIKKDSASYGSATAEEIFSAANELGTRCVIHGGGQGGLVTGIGKGGKLGIAMRPYNPTGVQCVTSAHFDDDCEAMVQNMPASREPIQVFGSADVRGVTQVVPRNFLTDSPYRCSLSILMEDNLPSSTVDTYTWYKLWEEAVAVKGMCLRFNHAGGFRHTGFDGNLQVSIRNPSNGVDTVGNSTLVGGSGNITQILVKNLELPGSSPIPSAATS